MQKVCLIQTEPQCQSNLDYRKITMCVSVSYSMSEKTETLTDRLTDRHKDIHTYRWDCSLYSSLTSSGVTIKKWEIDKQTDTHTHAQSYEMMESIHCEVLW